MPTLIAILIATLLSKGPQVDYTLRVDSTDFTTFAVSMHIRNAPDSFTLAAAAHAEYDDKYWRYIEDISVSSGRVVRADSVLWRVSGAGPELTVQYRVRPPVVQGQRAAWRAFMTPTGGLVGGPHAFLYVLGAEAAPTRVRLELPAGWQIATGLNGTADPRAFTATNVDTLMDSPIMVGRLREWQFEAGGVPHRIVYWGIPNGTAFDTTEFRTGIERLTRETIAFWGSTPYSNYTYIFQDGAFGGGLEHVNSVTLGAPSADLAANPHAYLREAAHEFVHTWNLMRIRPAEYRFVDYRAQPPVSSLWFSEGLTLFYADLLTRRAGLPTEDTREQHLASLIARNLANPGYARFSAEQISLVQYNAQSGALGDFDGSSHLQGEVIGAMLDLMTRAVSNGARSMDDVMRLMLARTATKRGYTGTDVESAVESVCACDVTPFFDAYIRGASAIDFDRYLALAGMRAQIEWKPAVGRDSLPLADMNIRGTQTAPGMPMRLLLWNPSSAWVRAGLHTNDELIAINGTPITSWPEMRTLLSALRIGASARVEVRRPSGPFTVTVAITGYQVPVVRIEDLPSATEKQSRRREAWRAGR